MRSPEVSQFPFSFSSLSPLGCCSRLAGARAVIAHRTLSEADMTTWAVATALSIELLIGFFRVPWDFLRDVQLLLTQDTTYFHS